MSRSSRQERIHTLTRKALEGYAHSRAERERRLHQPPQPGDIFVLAAASRIPIEWVVLERDPEAPDRFLAVAADLNPPAGSADVAVPAGTAAGPLSVRCGSTVRLRLDDLDPAWRTGFLEPEYLDRVRRKRSDIAAGTLFGSHFEQEADSEPEYRDWMKEVIEQTRAVDSELATVLHAAPAEAPGRLVRARRAPAWAAFATPYRLAAAILLLVTLGLVGGVVWQQREIGDRPMVNLPLAFFGAAGTVRGEAATLAVPPTASQYLLLFEVNATYPAYRLEIHAQGAAAPVWSSDELTKIGISELSVALPGRLFPAAEYRLRLYGLSGDEADLLAEHALRIEAP